MTPKDLAWLIALKPHLRDQVAHESLGKVIRVERPWRSYHFAPLDEPEPLLLALFHGVAVSAESQEAFRSAQSSMPIARYLGQCRERRLEAQRDHALHPHIMTPNSADSYPRASLAEPYGKAADR